MVIMCMDAPWVVLYGAEFVYLDWENILKPFVVNNLKMFEKGFAEFASGTTVIHFNTHTAPHTCRL